MKVKVFLTQNVKNIGMAGEMVSVSDGYASNFLLPRKLGIRVTKNNKAEFEKRLVKVEKRAEAIKTETSMLAEKIKTLEVTIAAKMHDDGKLYAAIRPQLIVDALADKGVSISKNMVVFNKSIKEKGSFPVTIKLSGSLQPKITVKVVSEK